MPKATTKDPGVLRLDFARAHRSYVNAAGTKVPGVTTVLGILAKPALIAWANNEGLAGRKIDRVSQQAADIGTVAHALCEAHVRGMTLETDNVTPEMLGKAETSFLRFLEWFDKAGLTVVATEAQLVSEQMQVGGTADIVAQTHDGDLWLADMKTGKGLYEEMYVQAATYSAMWEEVHGSRIGRVYLVRIPKEENDQLEVKEVLQRQERVAAFAALAEARRKLLKTGWKA